MRGARVVASGALTAALLTACVHPVDVEPTDQGSPVATGQRSTATSTTTSTTSHPSLQETDLPSTLRVAISFDQPGVGLREGNTYSGLDADVARYIARYLGISRITFVEGITNQRETLLATGQADLVLAAYSITPERADEVTFAGPYLTTGQDLLVAKSSTIRTPKQLRGTTVCSVEGSTSTSELVNDYPGLHLTVQPRVSDCIKLLKQGKVEAVTSDSAVLATFAQKSKAPDKLRLSGKPFTKEQWGVAMRRTDSALCEDVSDALADMVKSGAWKRAVHDNLGTGRTLSKRTLTPPKLRACPPPRTSTSSTSGTSSPTSS